jgi:hypothetical protein
MESLLKILNDNPKQFQRIMTIMDETKQAVQNSEQNAGGQAIP